MTKHDPKTYPCGELEYDHFYDKILLQTTFFKTNPTVNAIYEGYHGWKCGETAVKADLLGDVIFKDTTLADNLVAGFDVEQ